MDLMTEYMSNNWLSLNRGKTIDLVLSDNPDTRESLSVQLGQKTIQHSETVNILGGHCSEKWNQNLIQCESSSVKFKKKTL